MKSIYHRASILSYNLKCYNQETECWNVLPLRYWHCYKNDSSLVHGKAVLAIQLHDRISK